MSESDRDWDHVSQSVVSAAAGGQAAAAPGAAGPGGGGRDQPEPGARRLQPRLDLPGLGLPAVQPGEQRAGQQRGRAGGQHQLLAQPRPQRGERGQLRQRTQRQHQQQRGGAADRPAEQPQAGLDSAHHAGGQTLLLQVSHFLSSLSQQRVFRQAF